MVGEHSPTTATRQAAVALREAIAQIVMEENVCGLIVEGERVFCDDYGLEGHLDGYEQPLRRETCECKNTADRIIAEHIDPLRRDYIELKRIDASLEDVLGDLEKYETRSDAVAEVCRRVARASSAKALLAECETVLEPFSQAEFDTHRSDGDLVDFVDARTDETVGPEATISDFRRAGALLTKLKTRKE